jgi:hypothetical protein
MDHPFSLFHGMAMKSFKVRMAVQIRSIVSLAWCIQVHPQCQAMSTFDVLQGRPLPLKCTEPP